MIRVGQGFDVHRHTDDESRPLVLGGCLFEGERGLDGHSDADVPAHAAADALLGAAGLGDIGRHFPDTDAQFRGADSAVLLAEAARRVRAAGWQIGNVDSTVIAQAPKLAPHVAAMRAAVAAAAGLAERSVSIKIKSCDRLGAVGREEGIAAEAVALVRCPTGREPSS